MGAVADRFDVFTDAALKTGFIGERGRSVDNTFFSGLTSTVSGNIELALTAVLTIAALILGSTVGYKVYKRFTA